MHINIFSLFLLRFLVHGSTYSRVNSSDLDAFAVETLVSQLINLHHDMGTKSIRANATTRRRNFRDIVLRSVIGINGPKILGRGLGTEQAICGVNSGRVVVDLNRDTFEILKVKLHAHMAEMVSHGSGDSGRIL